MANRSARSASYLRWGLLVTTLVLGLILVAMGVVSYLGAWQTARAVVRARGLDMAISVRRELRGSGGDYQQALTNALEDMGDQGLRYVALATASRGVVYSAGETSSEITTASLRSARPGAGPSVTMQEDRVRVTLAGAGGAGLGRGDRPGPEGAERGNARWGNLGWRGKAGLGKGGGRFWKNRGKAGRGGPWWASNDATIGGEPPRRAVLVLEFEPLVAATIIRRALGMLIACLAASSLLILAAVFFWRASRRAEQMQVQLAQDRQLKALGEMSAVLGHELRNPLAALKGHAQLLVELLDGHPGFKGAQTVVREALRMEKLTEQILEFARTGTVDKASERPADVAQAAVEQAGSSWIETSIDEGLPDWSIDRIRIERVLINLLKNAIQASPSESVVELAVRAEQGGLLFEVRDHGEGLPPGEEVWIFEPFHTKRVRGTGLGLAVSKRIVDAHGGWITASNHPEGGALFRVWLPPE